MKEATKLLKNYFEEKKFNFTLTEAKTAEDSDWVDFPVTLDLTKLDFRICVNDGIITIFSWVINTVEKEKYGILLEILNKLNDDFLFSKFYSRKNDDEESYYVVAQLDYFYPVDNYDPEETFDIVVEFIDILEKAYPQIIKAIM